MFENICHYKGLLEVYGIRQGLCWNGGQEDSGSYQVGTSLSEPSLLEQSGLSGLIRQSPWMGKESMVACTHRTALFPPTGWGWPCPASI